MPLDFPSSPTNGQVYGNYYYNSARGAWNALLPAATPNFFINATLNSSTLVDATATSSLISTTPLVVKGLSGQTAYLQEWQNSSGTRLAGFDSNANLAVSNRVHVGTSSYAGDFWLYVVSKVAANTVVAVRGAASQTGNLQEWQNSAGSVLSRINSSGNLIIPTVAASYNIETVAGAASVTPLTVKAAASQTADLQQWQSSTGAVLSEINSAGELQVPRLGVGSVMPTTSMIATTASSATQVPLVVRGASAQTAMLQSWQDNAGNILSSVDAAGRATFSAGGGTLQLKASSTQDHAYMELYARTATPNARSAYIGYGSNGSNDLRITNEIASSSIILSSSYVTIPNQPLFSGTDTRALVVTNAVLTSSNCFNQIDYNVGNHFNASTGRFTAPVAGYYEMSAHIGDASSASTGTNIRLSKNGALNTGPLAEGYNQTAGGAVNVFVKSYIYCAVGDYLEFQAAALNTLGGVQHKRFLIRLLQ